MQITFLKVPICACDALYAMGLMGSAVRVPAAFFEEEARCVIAGAGGVPVLEGERYFAFLEDIIIGIPGEYDQRLT